MAADYTVALVADPDYGPRITQVAEEFDTWVIHSRINRWVVDRLWQRNAALELTSVVTIFSIPALLDSSESWLAILGDIELTHGGLSHDPPLSRLKVFGCQISPEANAALEQFGYGPAEAETDGFFVTKKPEVPQEM